MEKQKLFPVADGVMDTANGRWITCTPENMLMYDMFHRSQFMHPETFEAAIEAAWDAGYTPKMWIPKEGYEDTETPPGEGTP